MATPHNGAKKGDIAKTVLLPGDPLRAKFIAETFLENPVCYNTVRNMFGYTGSYKGRPVSVQGTGMGVPSLSIYVTELIQQYDVDNVIRIGTCGSIQPDVKVRDVIMAQGSCTDSNVNRVRFKGLDYAPIADFGLMQKAWKAAEAKGVALKVGNILTSDTFYGDDPDSWRMWAAYNVLAVEMETAALYTIAAKYRKRALTLLTVSDSIVANEATTAEERQTTFKAMMEIALELA
ncbi:MAG: purine-nucleoside phosphorylase [Spirochaetae bacterium HGW-Spirochaetae-3]|jgi:purine-nucleoside phosphorylase|nr:MAG: purine-nucleoside phosphorylase [Spirochaetae bacterium HGW-Spirochaetae-3]